MSVCDEIEPCNNRSPALLHRPLSKVYSLNASGPLILLGNVIGRDTYIWHSAIPSSTSTGQDAAKHGSAACRQSPHNQQPTVVETPRVTNEWLGCIF